MIVEVTLTKKDRSVEVLNFEKSSLLVGRSAGNDILVDEGGVSRFHARILAEEGIVTIQDLDSMNGTLINGNKVVSGQVNPDDEVVVGDCRLRVRVVDELGDATFESHSSSPVEPPVLETAPAPEDGDRNVSAPTRDTTDSFYWRSLESFLQPIWDFITDDAVSEILVNGPDQIYIEKRGSLTRVDRRFTTDQLTAAILNIAQYVGRRVSEDEPYLDARLPDGSRVAVLTPPCSRKGSSISIRKFSKEKLTLDKLVGFGSLSKPMVRFLEGCVLLKKNIVISGGTSSGKTSLLNVISGLIPSDERILTIEDSAELQLLQEHVLPMETKPPDKKGRGEVTIRDLVRASLRMRPDRIVVGEIRSGEALDLLQAMNTGHSGSMCTVHASSPPQALTRLETLALFSGLEIPVRALREQVSTAIDFIVQVSRLPDHSRKVTHISEVEALAEDGSYRVGDVFRFVRTGSSPDKKIIGEHTLTGYRPSIIEELELVGLPDIVEMFPAKETKEKPEKQTKKKAS